MRPFLVLAAFLTVTPAFAAPFSPEPLRISAPTALTYHFDNTTLKFPVKMSAPATVIFSIFTKDRDSLIKHVRSGHLSWHYVNLIDTCIYLSSPYSFTIGENTISWNGKNQYGRRIYSRTYDFYLWAYGHGSPLLKATDSIRFNRFDRSFMQMLDGDGKPLVNPILFDAPQSFAALSERTRKVRGRWAIGSDPSNPALLETTSYLSWAENSNLALDPHDPSMFFTGSFSPTGRLVIEKRKWIPGGDAVPERKWGDNGETSHPSAFDPGRPLYGGPIAVGSDFLLSTFIENAGSETRGKIIYFDIADGTKIQLVEFGTWWRGTTAAPAGPSALGFTRYYLLLDSPLSCIFMMMDPFEENRDNFVRWVNGNGDGIGDKNYEPNSPIPWACADPNRPPFNGTLSADANLFSVFPADGMSAASFGLFAPDGTGVGYFTIPGMEGGRVYGMHVVDTGTPYDGLYYGGVSADGDSAGVWYMGYDSLKGSIRDPIDFFGPFIYVTEPYDGDLMIPGERREIIWYAGGPKTVRIEFTADGGVSWITLADSVSFDAGKYLWTVPAVDSQKCRIRVIDDADPTLYSYMKGFFSILGPSGITDGTSIPRSIVAVSNRPNPFNPSTTIRYELGMPGKVTLTVYNALGQQVRTHDLGRKEKGIREFRFDCSGLTSGVYFYRVEAGNASATGRMMLLR